jgi:hypothetical protein
LVEATWLNKGVPNTLVEVVVGLQMGCPKKVEALVVGVPKAVEVEGVLKACPPNIEGDCVEGVPKTEVEVVGAGVPKAGVVVVGVPKDGGIPKTEEVVVGV